MIESTSTTSAPYSTSTLVSPSPPRFIFPLICEYSSLYRESSLLLLKKGNAALKVSFVSQTPGLRILLYNVAREGQEKLLFNIVISKCLRHQGQINLKPIKYIEELNNLYLYRVKYSAIELPAKSRGVDLVISLIKLLYSFLYSLNIILLYYYTYLYLIVVSY